jgi:hypothetical protein
MLGSLPLWPTINPDVFVSAKGCLATNDENLLISWNSEKHRFIEPKFLKHSFGYLERLGVEKLYMKEVLKKYIIPNMPSRICAGNKQEYLKLITSISRHRFDYQCLSGSNIAMDGSCMLRRVDQLYDHSNNIFSSAFRDDSETKFLHPECRPQRQFFIENGLRGNRDSELDASDYTSCLEAIKHRLESSQGHLHPTLLSDTETVLEPITKNTYAVRGFDWQSWSKVCQQVAIPAMNDFGTQPSFRRQIMQQRATDKPLVRTFENFVYLKYIDVCWTQTPFPRFDIDEAILRMKGLSGRPPIAMVWKHLEHLSSVARTVDGDEIASFIQDVRKTYHYLQDNLNSFRKTDAFIPKTPVWLNVDAMNDSLITQNDLKSCWTNIDALMLHTSMDSPPLMAVRSFLQPCERLLQAAGCASIIYPSLAAPTNLPATTSTIAGIRELRDNDRLLDVTFVADGQSIRAHQVVLAAVSKYCATHFNGHWDTSDSIVLEDMSYLTLSQMVKFAYEDNIDFDSMRIRDQSQDSSDTISNKLQQYIDLLEGANRWVMPALGHRVEKEMMGCVRNWIQAGNVLEIAELASRLNAKEIKDYCDDFYKKNQETVDRDAALKNMDNGA